MSFSISSKFLTHTKAINRERKPMKNLSLKLKMFELMK